MVDAVPPAPSSVTRSSGGALEVLWVALWLGLTSFGGPVAHLGYFREEYVQRRRWLDDRAYADLVALCQFLPGPASSQVGIAIGTARAGWLGGLLAWVGFTLPSAVAMALFAFGVTRFDLAGAGWLHGLKVAAVAVVANAVWGMAPGLAAGRVRGAIAIGAACVVLLVPSSLAQVAVIAAAGLVGWRLLARSANADATTSDEPADALPRGGRRVAAGLLAAFVVLLVGLPLLRGAVSSHVVAMVDVYYRVASLVFGGGHVVLPLLQAEVVPPGWVPADRFIAGYGAAQAVPGPLFSFAAFLGAVQEPAPNGWLGAAVALGALYLPSFLLVWGVLPFWARLREVEAVQAASRGMGAAVVGVLLAAVYTPVWTSAILGPPDLALALVCLGMLAVWRLPPWTVVAFAALAGAAMTRVG